MARVIVVAEPGTAPPRTARVTSSDVRDPHVAAQLIERIGWALADAEDVESGRAVRPDRAGRTA